MKNFVPIIIVASIFILNVQAQNKTVSADSTTKKYYELGWGSNPNTELISRNSLSITSLTFDKINGKIHYSKIDNVFFRSVNFLVVLEESRPPH